MDLFFISKFKWGHGIGCSGVWTCRYGACLDDEFCLVFCVWFGLGRLDQVVGMNRKGE